MTSLPSALAAAITLAQLTLSPKAAFGKPSNRPRANANPLIPCVIPCPSAALRSAVLRPEFAPTDACPVKHRHAARTRKRLLSLRKCRKFSANGAGHADWTPMHVDARRDLQGGIFPCGCLAGRAG